MFFAGLLAFVVGSAVMLFLSVMILFGIVGSMTSSEAVTVGEHAILKLDFSEDLIDSPSSDPFAGIDFATMTAKRQVTLYNALRAIETAKIDPRIQGIYLRPNGGGMATYAILEELREALQDFRQSGKFVIAYNETYGQGGYYLASVADEIYLEPHGGMQWMGVSSTLMFYKGLFDKLDIQAEIFRPTACRYKSAVEPYFLSKMSNANREQMQALVNSMWNTIAGSVAEARGIEDGDIVKMFNERGTILCGARISERVTARSVVIAKGSRVDPIAPHLDRGGAANLICPGNQVSKHCKGFAVTGYLAEVAKVTDEEYEGWKRDYPEAFARDYDPAIGINRKSWVIEK